MADNIVYRLNRSIEVDGQVHMTGGSAGELHATLTGAMKAFQWPVKWTLVSGMESVWKSNFHDLITQVKVKK